MTVAMVRGSRDDPVDGQRVSAAPVSVWSRHQVTLTGSGSITAYEGARYYVDIVKDSAGTWRRSRRQPRPDGG
jgi:hypothetical protein